MTINTKLKTLFWLTIIAALLIGFIQLEPISPFNTNTNPIIINEIMAANSSTLSDEDGQYPDWIELYNPSSQSVNLLGWSLSDDPDQPDKWTFPNISLAADEYLIVFASAKNKGLHTNFKLNKNGEILALYRPDSRRYLDSVPIKLQAQLTDVSYGRSKSDNTFYYFSHPTPGQANDETTRFNYRLPPVQANYPHGFYTHPFTVTLSVNSPNTAIFYTIDGREPTPETSTAYQHPILITHTTLLRVAAFKKSAIASPSVTYSYIFIEDVLQQPSNPPNFPTTWGTHSIDVTVKANKKSYQAGTPVEADYEMDPQVVNNPRFQSLLQQGLTDIPSLSIVTDIKNFDIYTNPTQRGLAWERPVSVELITPNNPQGGFQINAGLRIQGHSGRYEYVPKHSFRLFFRGEYGDSQLNYPLFPDSPVDNFKTLILRAGVNRSYAGNKDARPRKTAYTRDQWVRNSQIEISGTGSHGMFVHLYLNGLYWGLYNVVERPDSDFATAYFGGNEDEWHSHNHDGPIKGDAERVFTLAYAMLDLEHGGFADPENYAFAQSYLDIPHFIDYVILNWYAGNQDWPTTNWYALVHNPNGKIRFFAWDAEHTWTKGALLYFELEAESNLIGRLFMALMHNPDFKMTFADRVYKLLYHNGPLTEQNSKARWLRLNQPLLNAIIGESARWGDTRYDDDPILQERWLEEVGNVLEQMTGNVDKLINLLREAGHYPPFNPPTFSKQGGLVQTGFQLKITPPATTQGVIYYTLDGSDPRQTISGAVASTALIYNEPLLITQSITIKARLWHNSTWSALNETLFLVEQPLSNLVITELMYNPPGGDAYEFIELKNVGNVNLNISNLSFSGIRFTIPNGTVLSPNQIMVLGRDAVAFTERYPTVSLSGIYQGKLSNKGETITINNPYGSPIVSFQYDDENGWPLSADGHGDSLVLVNPSNSPNNPQNWQGSSHLYGSPGYHP